VLGIGIPELLLIFVAIPLFGLWIWMLIECATKETGNDRIVWTIIVVFTQALGALIYFFVRYLPRRRRM
jgi:Phospholipase_D-nuclease N-terminal